MESVCRTEKTIKDESDSRKHRERNSRLFCFIVYKTLLYDVTVTSLLSTVTVVCTFFRHENKRKGGFRKTETFSIATQNINCV